MGSFHSPEMAVSDLYKRSGMNQETDSLNTGNELDDEVAELEDPMILSIKELKDVSDIIQSSTSLESKLDDLMYLARDIVSSGGMCQTFAMEAEKLLPGFGNVPIGYYTKDLTATRYRVSLEEIHKGIWALLAAAFKAIKNIISKIFSFFTGNKDNSDPKAAAENVDQEIKDVDNNTEVVKETREELHRADGLLRQATLCLIDKNEKAFHCTSLQQAIDELLSDSEIYSKELRFLELKDPVYRDLVMNGPYTSLVTEVGKKLMLMNELMTSRLKLLDTIIAADVLNHSNASQLQNRHELNKLQENVVVTIHGKEYTLYDLSGAISSEFEKLTGSETEEHLNYDSMFMAVERLSHNTGIKNTLKETKHMFSHLEELRNRLNKVDKSLRDVNTDGIPGALSSGFATDIREVAGILTRDMIGYQKLLSEISNFVYYLKKLFKETIGFGNAIITKITKEMKRNDQEIPLAWEEVHSNVMSYRAKIRDNFAFRKN